MDSGGNVYVGDTYNNVVRKVSPFGVVSTFATGFSYPGGVVVDSIGNVYVGDQGNARVCMITPAGVVSTVATGFGSPYGPYGVSLDSNGAIYVSDVGTHRISKIAITDPNIYAGTTLTGTLLTSFNPALSSSTITIPAGTTNAKVASFTVAAASLPLKTSVTGVWSTTLYATVGLSTSPASFYFQVVDGATTVATGTTTTSVNQSSPMQLYKSNLTIPARTYSSDLTLNIFATTQASSSLTLGFNGSTISYVNTTIPSVGVTGPTGPAGVGVPISFDGGFPSSSFSFGPALDCGRVD